MLIRRTCLCGYSFEPTRSTNIHCSKRCRKRYGTTKRRYGKPIPLTAPITKICKCGNHFLGIGHNKRFCSVKCRKRQYFLNNREHLNAIRKQHRHAKKMGIDIRKQEVERLERQRANIDRIVRLSKAYGYV